MQLMWIAVVAFVLLTAFAIFIYQLPAERMAKRKRQPPPPPKDEKDWQAIAGRWEKNNALLNNEIESLKKERKNLSDQIQDNEKLIREQVEQLSREKAWREKETISVEKVKQKDNEIKSELDRAQKAMDEEHALRLRLQSELQSLKVAHGQDTDEKRTMAVKIMTLEKELDIAKAELRELRRQNAELTKKKDDVQWIAKTDYDQLLAKYKQVEKDLARLSRDSSGNS